jgi:tetratricopeptide (TPR) repeat protein
MQTATALAHFLAGRYSDASSWAERALRKQADYTAAVRVAAASHALAGRQADAEKAIARLCDLDPAFHISDLSDRAPLRRPQDLTKFAEGLRKAGLRE